LLGSATPEGRWWAKMTAAALSSRCWLMLFTKFRSLALSFNITDFP
jgi:hypothetical protein